MESSAIARYIPQKSKKRVFLGSKQKEPDVIEIAPPSAVHTSTKKSKANGKQKEVAFHEIIDVDMDEDRNDVVFIEGKVESNKKMKGSTGISISHRNASQFDSKKKGKVVLADPTKSFTPGSNNFFDLDDSVYDDDYFALQTHFDNMDLPTGIEAPIPWLPDLVPAKGQSQSQPNYVDPLSTYSLIPPSQSIPSLQIGPTNSSIMKKNNHKKLPPHNMLPNYSQSLTGFNFSDYPIPSTLGLGVGTPFPEWGKSIANNHLDLSNTYETVDMLTNYGDIYSMDDMLTGQDTGNGPNPNPNPNLGPIGSNLVGSSSNMATLDKDGVLKKYENFKKFDTVIDFSDHLFAKQSSLKQPLKNWAKKIQDEWRILEKDLPDTIFVRVYESRMDLLRAVIIGAEGTPYHDGLFFFDVCFTSSYPNSPPLVKYHSGGLRINPNLYNCGKVCLSLLNTWNGGQQEKWIPGTSTMLQVLVSIQGLILNMKPYFNEPGYANSSGSVQGEKRSLQYNENTLILSLKTMVYTMKKPPKYFEDLVVGHFRNRVRDILMACKAYTEGVQVGCLVKGGVQDLDEGNDDSCSLKFKNDVIAYVKVLIAAFKKIGAKEADEFRFLTEKKISETANANANANAPIPAAAAAHVAHAYSKYFIPPIPTYNHHW